MAVGRPIRFTEFSAGTRVDEIAWLPGLFGWHLSFEKFIQLMTLSPSTVRSRASVSHPLRLRPT